MRNGVPGEAYFPLGDSLREKVYAPRIKRFCEASLTRDLALHSTPRILQGSDSRTGRCRPCGHQPTGPLDTPPARLRVLSGSRLLCEDDHEDAIFPIFCD